MCSARARCTTNTDGVAEFTRDLQPVNNSLTTYTITASFDGDDPDDASATSTTLDGTSYAACTTVQYNGYEPSTNSIVLTVTPQSTQTILWNGTVPEKPNGSYDIWGQFIWGAPWYRLHFTISVGETKIDVGIALFPHGLSLFPPILIFPSKSPDTYTFQGLDIFKEVTEKCIEEFVAETGTLMVEYAAAKAGLWALQPEIAVAALGLETGQEAGSFMSYWNQRDGMLAFGIANIVLGLISVNVNIAEAFLRALFNIVSAPALGL